MTGGGQPFLTGKKPLPKLRKVYIPKEFVCDAIILPCKDPNYQGTFTIVAGKKKRKNFSPSINKGIKWGKTKYLFKPPQRPAPRHYPAVSVFLPARSSHTIAPRRHRPRAPCPPSVENIVSGPHPESKTDKTTHISVQLVLLLQIVVQAVQKVLGASLTANLDELYPHLERRRVLLCQHPGVLHNHMFHVLAGRRRAVGDDDEVQTFDVPVGLIIVDIFIQLDFQGIGGRGLILPVLDCQKDS